MKSWFMAAMLAAIAFTASGAQAAPKTESEAAVADAPISATAPYAAPSTSPTVTLAAKGPTPYSAAAATFNVGVPNATAGKARLQITEAAARPADAKATWRLTDTGAILQVGSATQEVTRRAAPIALQLDVSGFQVGQEYAAEILLLDTTGVAIGRTPVRVRRGSAILESKGFTGPMASSQNNHVGPVELVLRLSNDAKEPLAVGLPALVELTRKQGGATVLSDLKATQPKVVCGAAELTTAPVVLAPGAQCQARLTLDAREAGEYKAKVSVTDISGTTALADTTANVRERWGLVVGIALVGTIVGWFLQYWTKVGRPRLALLERLYEALSAWKAVDAKADDLALGIVTGPVGRRLAELHRPGGLTEENAAELDGLAVRVRRLEQWIALEVEAGPVSTNPGVIKAAAAVRAALQKAVDPADDAAADKEIQARLEALALAIEKAKNPAGRRAAFAAPVRDFAVTVTRVGLQGARFLRRTGDALVGVATMILVALSALQLVWLPNVAWGGLSDVLALFLGAVTAQAGALSVVDAFRNKFPART